MIMKKLTMYLWVAMMAIGANAQTLPAALGEAYNRLNTATAMPAMMDAANRFSLIATKWNQEWAANYYAAYARTLISYREQDTKRRDQLLDEADQYAAKVMTLRPNADESLVLAAYIAYAHLSVDPPNRWQKYLPIFNEDIEKAKTINPDNPRVYYLEGIPVFQKPVTYGGGKEVAKPYFEKAAALFAKQDSSSLLKPFWGEKENSEYLKQSQ
jgi:hypothetical protein